MHIASTGDAEHDVISIWGMSRGMLPLILRANDGRPKLLFIAETTTPRGEGDDHEMSTYLHASSEACACRFKLVKLANS